MSYHLPNNGWKVACHAFAEALRPPIQMRPSQWARQNLIVPDGPRKLNRWDASLTPYIIEPLDLTSTDSPENEFCVMKSAQAGFSTMLLAAIGHTIALDRADMMIVQPTDSALSDFNRKKLQPSLEETPATRRAVARQTSRSASGSTIYEKRFGRYTLTLALASSSADLRSKTVQKAFLDEVDEYPDDLDGQGSPLSMIEARQESFLRDGNWKRVMVSTPTIKGSSAIEAAFEASDKRKWHVCCPHCEGELVFTFGPHFHFEQKWPHKAYYSCPTCGGVIEERDRGLMVRAGRWVATAPAPGRKPGYHFDALSSPFVPWDKVAERYVEAAGDPQKLKAFYTLTLGLPFEMKGDAPGVEILMLRREELKRGHIPAPGVILVASADVQSRGIWFEVLAVARTRETWVVDAGFIDGSTEHPDGDAFLALRDRVLDKEWPDAFGRTRKIDVLGVDSGYRAQQVYSWSRTHQRINPMAKGMRVILALKGKEGWDRPALGQPSDIDITFGGKRVHHGAKIRTVGTFGLKAAFFDDLSKEGRKSGKESDPAGYCHFPDWIDEGYFKQLTGEYLDEQTYRGRTKRVWKQKYKDNHFLDCRVYNMALLWYVGFDKMDDDDWAALELMRGAPAGEAAAPVVVDQDAEEGDAADVVPEVETQGRKMSWREMMERRANV